MSPCEYTRHSVLHTKELLASIIKILLHILYELLINEVHATYQYKDQTPFLTHTWVWISDFYLSVLLKQ